MVDRTTEQFVRKAHNIHGDKYLYKLVEYKNNCTKITIICPEHGIFSQTPKSHLRGAGCTRCGHEARAKTILNKAASEFVAKAQLVHNKYTYDLVEYKGSHTKVKIICPEHGVFEQSPDSHISQKQGCPHCALQEKGFTRTKFKEKCIKNNNGLGILYVLECFNDNEHFFKIGITSRSIKERYNSKASMPYAYRVIDEIVGDPEYIFDLETEMHRKHKEHQYSPNIIFGGSNTECFSRYLTTIKGGRYD